MSEAIVAGLRRGWLRPDKGRSWRIPTGDGGAFSSQLRFLCTERHRAFAVRSFRPAMGRARFMPN